MTGDAVNLAARLVELARAGETFISDDVHRALAHVLDAEPQGTVADSRPRARIAGVEAARAARAGCRAGHADRPRRRAAAFRRASSRVAAAQDPAPRCSCARDPGMGKTRLAEEFLALRREQRIRAPCGGGARFRRGAGTRRDSSASIAALLGVARGCDGGGAARRARPGDRRSARRRRGRAVCRRPARVPQTRQQPLRSDGQRGAHGRASCDALADGGRTRARAQRRCVLLVEDVHWASPWVLACLRVLASCARRRPCIVLLLTSRREGDAITPAWPGCRDDPLRSGAARHRGRAGARRARSSPPIPTSRSAASSARRAIRCS